MASQDARLWQEALAQVQNGGGGPALPPWLWQADLVARTEPGQARAAAPRLQVRLPQAARPDDLSAAVRTAVTRALERTMGKRVELEFVARPAGARGPAVGSAPRSAPGPAPKPAADPAGGRWPARIAVATPGQARSWPSDALRLNPHYTFENFVTGPCNRMAHAAALAISDLPGRSYNPLFIHAGVGLGKSHLMQAICHKVRAHRPEVSALYVSCEDFVNQFIAAIGSGQIEEFRYRFRYLDILVIDDIHFLADKERTQEEFFHTFNTLYQAQKQVVLSSDSPPHEIPRLEERLVSRFKWGLVARIDRPSFETRVAIVQKKSKLRGVDLPDDVVRYIATAVDTNNRELEGAVIRTIGYASLSNRPVSPDVAKEALRDLAALPARTATIQQVADAVLVRYNARLSDLQGKRRTQSVSLPRQICMHLSRRLTNRSLGEIGVFFGGRDHTTVLHADRRIARMVDHDPVFRGIVEAIERDIQRP
ncbi:MAG: chromosomal replication initiator protein DnaA [Planctomycetes bacterium]|nr:chromosomal replication initiator protein DnaA [Planctomycetota bacterium]